MSCIFKFFSEFDAEGYKSELIFCIFKFSVNSMLRGTSPKKTLILFLKNILLKSMSHQMTSPLTRTTLMNLRGLKAWKSKIKSKKI